MEIVSICNNSDSYTQEVFAQTKYLVKEFMVEFKEAKTIHEKIEIAKIMQSQHNVAINAGQLVVNALKATIDANESNLKYSGLIPIENEKNAFKSR